MALQSFALFILWMFLYAYMIVASVDFGAGFYAFYVSTNNVGERKLTELINQHLSSIWEIATVFFIFFFVGIVGIFPRVAYYYGVPLLVPGSIAMILVAIRGSFYTFHQYGSKRSKLFMFVYGATSLLIPVSLSTVLTISEGGFILEKGTDIHFQPFKLLTNVYSISVMLLAICSVLFISAIFLLYYAKAINDSSSEIKLRKYYLFWSVPTIFSSVFVFGAMKLHNKAHFEHMYSYWLLFLLSFFFFILATALVYRKKYYGLALSSVLLQYLFAFFGYGLSHMPYFLYPYLRIDNSYTKSGLATVLVFIFFIAVVAFVTVFLIYFLKKPTLYLSQDREKETLVEINRDDSENQ